jgi:hypothetical protein
MLEQLSCLDYHHFYLKFLFTYFCVFVQSNQLKVGFQGSFEQLDEEVVFDDLKAEAVF